MSVSRSLEYLKRTPAGKAILAAPLLFFLVSCGGASAEKAESAATATTTIINGTPTTAILQEMQQQSKVHVVQDGDTLFDIARLYYGADAGWAEVNAIKAANGMTSDFLALDRKLVIPSVQSATATRTPTPLPQQTATPTIQEILENQTRYYVVQRGENINTIALKLNVSLTDFQSANPQVDLYKLIPGQMLVIP